MKYLDFKFYKENWLMVLALVVSIVFIKIFNLQHIMENTSLENLQLVALFFAFVFSFRAKNNKPIYVFLALILFLMFMRELSYGRVFYGRIPNGGAEAIYPLSHFKYGYLTHVFVGIYMAFIGLYALINKIWINAIDILKNIKAPVFTYLICILCVICQLVSEGTLHNTCIEETAELVLYTGILALVLIYTKQDK